MADARTNGLSSALAPERVAKTEFSNSFRGFDQAEVRSFLARVAGEMRALMDRESELVERLGSLETRREPEPLPVAEPAPLDEHHLTELLGAEAGRVLDAARTAAKDMRARARAEIEAEREAAQAEATSVRESAEEDARKLREAAESVLAERTAEAEAAAAELRAEAEDELDRARAEAEELRRTGRADAEAALETARQDGRRMVAEARAVRERILTDMARRRNTARSQLEKLRAARERLLESVEVVRKAVDGVTSEMNTALVDARLAGERAARGVDVNFIPPMSELDAEVETAKDTGLIDPAAIEAALAETSTKADGTIDETGEHPALDAGALDDGLGVDDGDAGGVDAEVATEDIVAGEEAAPAEDVVAEEDVVAAEGVVAGDPATAGEDTIADPAEPEPPLDGDSTDQEPPFGADEVIEEEAFGDDDDEVVEAAETDSSIAGHDQAAGEPASDVA
ncbi:MAG: DivIVA domain-containing protein, partial [Thermoleophilia bacterium]|nr:DivIVA domain-containing protein [Thermoleophilia bacterium]